MSGGASRLSPWPPETCSSWTCSRITHALRQILDERPRLLLRSCRPAVLLAERRARAMWFPNPAARWLSLAVPAPRSSGRAEERPPVLLTPATPESSSRDRDLLRRLYSTRHKYAWISHGASSLPVILAEILLVLSSSSKRHDVAVKSLSSPVKPITVVLFSTFMRSEDLYRFVEPYEPVRRNRGGYGASDEAVRAKV